MPLTTEPFGYYVYQPGNDLEVFPGKTGISGGGETTTVSPSDNLLNSITNETSLDQTQQDNLRAAFNEVYSKCSNKNFINSLKNNGFAFRFKIDPNLSTPGGYDPATNTIKFRSTADVNFDTLQEELFHAYQNLTANISGTLNPPYTGRSNVEFESKVYRDIVCVLGGGACSYWGGDTDEYASWLIEITSGWTTYPTWDKMQSKYFRFLVEFVNYNPSYNFPIDYSLAPTAIFKAYNGCKP